MSNALFRIQEQRAMRLLEALQSDIRSQIRFEGERKSKNGDGNTIPLSKPSDRKVFWSRLSLPTYKGETIQSLPNTREFWRFIDLNSLNKTQLEAVCHLLNLGQSGKKVELRARIQDWIYEPEIRAREQQLAIQTKERDEIIASGKVFAVGHNFNGELGVGHRGVVSNIIEVETLRGKRIQKVFSGYDANFVIAFSESGQAYGWGNGESLALSIWNGNNDSDSKIQSSSCYLFPTRISWINGRFTNLASSRSDGHFACVNNDGECFTWGKGDYGELGIGEITSTPSKNPRPVPVKRKVVCVSVGNCHTAAVTQDGKLYTWGGCWNGQLGLGESRRAGVAVKRLQLCFPSPTLVELLANVIVTRVSCGAVHSAVISQAGNLYTFGCGDGGRLGLGNNSDCFQPELVSSLQNERVIEVFCSNWHTLCIATPRDRPGSGTEGWVYAFGSGLNGQVCQSYNQVYHAVLSSVQQLGLGKQKMASLPTRLNGLYQRKVLCKTVTGSSHHSCALSSDGKLFTWGRNTDGCLGRKTPEADSAEPELIDISSTWANGAIESVAAGDRFTVFVTGAWYGESRSVFIDQDKLNRHGKFSKLPHSIQL